MLGHTFARFVLIASATALPRSFLLDMCSVNDAAMDLPPPPLNITSHAFDWPTTHQTASAQSTTTAPVYMPVLNSSMTTAVTINGTRTCLPTTTVVVTLPDPTPRPTSTSERNDENDSLTDDDATSFNTTISEPLSSWPHWFTAATFTLVVYDILTLGLFLWLWVFGYLWWFCWGDNINRRGGAWGRRNNDRGGVEMWQMDMPARYGEDGHEREWMGTTQYGRVRSESEQRARRAREAELEGEMRRLGMI